MRERVRREADRLEHVAALEHPFGAEPVDQRADHEGQREGQCGAIGEGHADLHEAQVW